MASFSDIFFGTPPTSQVSTIPGFKAPGYGFAQQLSKYLGGLIGQPAPSYQGSLDPGLSPTMQTLGKQTQAYSVSPAPYMMGQAAGTLGRYMNPTYGSVSNELHRPSIPNPFDLGSGAGGRPGVMPDTQQPSGGGGGWESQSFPAPDGGGFGASPFPGRIPMPPSGPGGGFTAQPFPGFTTPQAGGNAGGSGIGSGGSGEFWSGPAPHDPGARLPPSAFLPPAYQPFPSGPIGGDTPPSGPRNPGAIVRKPFPTPNPGGPRGVRQQPKPRGVQDNPGITAKPKPRPKPKPRNDGGKKKPQAPPPPATPAPVEEDPRMTDIRRQLGTSGRRGGRGGGGRGGR